MDANDFFEVEGIQLESGCSLLGGADTPDETIDVLPGSVYLQTGVGVWQLNSSGWSLLAHSDGFLTSVMLSQEVIDLIQSLAAVTEGAVVLGMLAPDLIALVQNGGSVSVSPAAAKWLPTPFTTRSTAFVGTGVIHQLQPNKSYWFDYSLLISSSRSSNGVGVAFGGTTDVVSFGAASILPNGANATMTVIHSALRSGAVTNSVPVANAPALSSGRGIITTGPLGGTFELLVRSETGVDSITVHAGTCRMEWAL